MLPARSADSQLVEGGEVASGFPFYVPHMMSGVDKLHVEGFIGAGIKVGIIDTGIDYHHPALGGCFGPGCKVAGGADFVGDAYNGTNQPIPGNTLSLDLVNSRR